MNFTKTAPLQDLPFYTQGYTWNIIWQASKHSTLYQELILTQNNYIPKSVLRMLQEQFDRSRMA